MPRPTSPHPDAERKSASPLHPRNRHLGRYDFPRLIAGSPELERFVILNPYGRQSIDFADPAAVKAFNRALLQQFYDVREWDIPDGYLCPPIPGRADYLHYLADLLGASHDGLIPRGPGLRALDVGTGANCIYPLLGHHRIRLALRRRRHRPAIAGLGRCDPRRQPTLRRCHRVAPAA